MHEGWRVFSCGQHLNSLLERYNGQGSIAVVQRFWTPRDAPRRRAMSGQAQLLTLAEAPEGAEV